MFRRGVPTVTAVVTETVASRAARVGGTAAPGSRRRPTLGGIPMLAVLTFLPFAVLIQDVL